MLRKKDIIKARDLTYTVTSTGGACGAKSGTPLSIINGTVNQILVPSTDTDGNETSLTSRESGLFKATNSLDLAGNEKHSIEMGAISKHTAHLIANSLNYARNTVAPLVKDIIKQVEDMRDSVNSYGDVAKRIASVSIAAPYNDPMLESLIDRNTRLQVTNKPISYAMAKELHTGMTVDIFKAVIETGNTVFDEKVVAIIDEMPEDIRKILITEGYMENTVNAKLGYDVYTDHNALFSYLFLLGLSNGRLESQDEAGMTHPERLMVSEALNYFGYQLNQKLKAYEMDIANNLLILYSMSYDTVYVLESTYTPWVEGEGSNEAILGFVSMSSNAKSSTPRQQQALIANPLRYGLLYDKSMRNETAEKRIRMNGEVDKLLAKNLYGFILDEYSEDMGIRKVLQDKLSAVLKANPYTHSIDIDAHVLRITCEAISNDKNDAYQILTTMRSYMMDNPEATPGTAALVAATKLIGRWIGSQMEIVYN